MHFLENFKPNLKYRRRSLEERKILHKMSLDEYKLRCELTGHSLDVRAVAEIKNCLVSASRDKTAKIWEPEGYTKTFIFI